MKLIAIAVVLVGCLSCVDSFANPSSDFLSGIDGSSIANGYGHVCAIEQRAGNNIGGRARCWGSDHKDHAMDAPRDMDFVQLVAGHDFTCGITPEQTVFCWGMISGYLPGLFEQITASSFANNVCGVLTDGKIYCTGQSTLPSLAPKDAAERFVQLSCSGEHCCALDSNAYPHCWGELPTLKQIHPPNITYSQYLVATSGPGVDMSILQNINKKTKGDDEDFESDASAKSVDSAGGDEQVAKIQFRQISVGEGVSCGITLLGAHLQCWGGHTKTPVQSPGPYRQVSVGRKGICAITASAEDTDANPSDTSAGTAAMATPATPATTTGHARRRATKERVRTREGDKLHCWGTADALVHYSGDRDAETYQWDQVNVGAWAVCAVSMDSELRCWGLAEPLPEEVTDRPSSFIVA